ncbi:hypothetical protein IDH21_00885 [Pelagibacterales bacterium SAG-MED47]|nr:hypothetical protein [Pelagibacterales bacterium SAG-MED47]
MNYKILDNFLDQTSFDYLSSLKLKNVSPNEVLNHHNRVYKNGEIESHCISSEILKNLQNSCHKIAINLLNELAPHKTSLYEYTDFNIIETGKDYTFPIHRDHVNKLLSGVIYLKPEKNTGTIIYKNKKGDNPCEIPWKENRALFFSRTEKNSWHNYKGDGKNNRIVLVYNLMTTDTKAICKLEKINYNFIKFREFINPYFYRIFKKVL